jgi:hypothetical protein
MADVNILSEGGDDECGERGPRGRRGHDGPIGPTGSTGPTGSGGVAALIAAALVNSDGTFPLGASHPGFSAVVHSGLGVYTLTMTNFPANGNNLIVNATQTSLVDGTAVWISPGAPDIVVRTFDTAGLPADRIFTVTAYDTTP